MAKKTDSEIDSYAQELWETAMRLINIFRTGGSVLEEMELTFPQTMLLLELRVMGECSMGELSRRLGITQGVATRMVDRLVERGLVERRRDKADRRVVRVTLAQKAEGIAKRIENENRERLKQLFATVPEKERADLIAILKAMERQFEKEGMPRRGGG